MKRKQNPTRRFIGVFFLSLGVPLVAHRISAQPVGTGATLDFRPITGPLSCANSSCHGGADEKSRQFVTWSQHDVHSRAYATLTTARAARMAEALKIPDATTSARCTTCHAPVQTVAPSLRAADAHIADGVSCVSCHGPSDPWLRTHTRLDLTHDDRVAGGMRDLRNLYHRANACVSCHQNLESEVVGVGRHPALHFELDGLTHSQPMHWREPAGRSGAQAWLVGQAVALRETSAALTSGQADISREVPRWQALVWLVQRAGSEGTTTALGKLSLEAVPANFAVARQVADQVAQHSANAWSATDAKPALTRLAKTHAEFRDANISALSHACRAERLVMGLDRLLAALPAGEAPREASAQLNKLFRLVQSQPEFAPVVFATELAIFSQLFGK